MASHSDDFERFGIDRDAPDGAHRLDLARFLADRGVTDDTITADPTIETLNRRVWARIFIGTDDLISFADAADVLGMDVTALERIGRLLGLPISEDTRLAVEDARVLRTFAEITELLGDESAQQVTRTIGSAMARIAETIISMTRVGVETPMIQESSYISFVETIEPVVAEYFPRLATVMDRVFRYHVLAASGQAWGVDAEMSAMTITRAVGFADMVGFTTRAGASSTRELTVIIDAFENRVSDAIGRHGGRAVKFIGDEVFFSFVDPDDACACALDLLALAGDDTMPDVRVGMAYGEVVGRGGDYYGPVVNLASRLVDVAETGAAFVSDGLARAASKHTFEAMAVRELKGVGETVSYARLTS